jgi:hypothetical protein
MNLKEKAIDLQALKFKKGKRNNRCSPPWTRIPFK